MLRLLRGEDLESVSRGLGVTAATLSGCAMLSWRRCEASLSTRPLDADALESGVSRPKLGEMLLERELLEAKVAALEARAPALWPAGGRGHEPDRLAGQRQRLRAGSVCRIWRVSRATVHGISHRPRSGPDRRPGPIPRRGPARSGRCRMPHCSCGSAPS